MDANRTVERGNSFALRFVLALLFVHLTIVIPSYYPDPELQRRLQAAESRLRSFQQEIHKSLTDGYEPPLTLKATGSAMAVAGAKNARPRGTATRASSVKGGGKATTATSTSRSDQISAGSSGPGRALSAAMPKATASTVQTQVDASPAAPLDRVKWLSLTDKLLELEQQSFVLQKERLARREFSVPFVDLKLDDAMVLGVYPVGSLLGLIAVMFYRRDYFKTAASDDLPPIWAAPFALSAPSSPGARSTVSAWSVNAIGIVCHISVIYIIVDFLRRNHFQLRPEFLTIIVIVGGLLAGLYAVAVVDVIRAEYRQSRANTSSSVTTEAAHE
jgi:hypothetical protein